MHLSLETRNQTHNWNILWNFPFDLARHNLLEIWGRRKILAKKKINERKFKIKTKWREIEREGRGSSSIKESLDCDWKPRERDLVLVKWSMKRKGWLCCWGRAWVLVSITIEGREICDLYVPAWVSVLIMSSFKPQLT